MYRQLAQTNARRRPRNAGTAGGIAKSSARGCGKAGSVRLERIAVLHRFCCANWRSRPAQAGAQIKHVEGENRCTQTFHAHGTLRDRAGRPPGREPVFAARLLHGALKQKLKSRKRKAEIQQADRIKAGMGNHSGPFWLALEAKE